MNEVSEYDIDPVDGDWCVKAVVMRAWQGPLIRLDDVNEAFDRMRWGDAARQAMVFE